VGVNLLQDYAAFLFRVEVSGVRLWLVYIGTLAGSGEEERKFI